MEKQNVLRIINRLPCLQAVNQKAINYITNQKIINKQKIIE